MIRVYVAGPYTRPDPIENTHRAIRVGDDLLSLGYIPFIPHLTAFWHLLRPRPYQEWLDYDLEWVRVCGVLLRLPGESSGADTEVAFARCLDIPVVHSVDELQRRFPLT